MNYFWGSSNYLLSFSAAMMVKMSSFLFLIIILTSGHLQPEASRTLLAAEDNNIYELLTRDELVQMAGYGEDKLSTVLVTGSLFCHRHRPSISSDSSTTAAAWPLSGALVSVDCHNNHKKMISRSRGYTDENGEFRIDLPSRLHSIPDLEKKCSVKVIRLPNKHSSSSSRCRRRRPAAKATATVNVKQQQKGLKLLWTGNGIRTYAAGTISFFQY